MFILQHWNVRDDQDRINAVLGSDKITVDDNSQRDDKPVFPFERFSVLYK
jgi:hypothetical protein